MPEDARRRQHQRLRRGRPHRRRRRVRSPRGPRPADPHQRRGRHGGRAPAAMPSATTCSPDCWPARWSPRGAAPSTRSTTAGAASGFAATTEGDELVLSGSSSPVEAAAQAQHLLVTAATDDGLVQFLVPADTAGVTVSPAAQRRPRPPVRPRRLRRRPARRLRRGSAAEATTAADVERQLQHALVIQTAEMVGAAERTFDFTVEWAFDRYSFGRPLASYQELKHRFADMKMWVEASHALAAALAREVQAGSAERGRDRQRGQGLHRPVPRRADAGLRADARRHRPHLRPRHPPLPAPGHGRPGPATAPRPITASASAPSRQEQRHERRPADDHRPRWRASSRSRPGPGPGCPTTSRAAIPTRRATTASAPTRRSWPRSSGCGRSSARSTTAGSPASASRSSTAAWA